MHIDSGLSDLGDFSRKIYSRIGVYGESGLLADTNGSHIGFVYVGVHLHFGQVLRDLEDGRCLERGGHGLADVHVARDDGAVDGRQNLEQTGKLDELLLNAAETFDTDADAAINRFMSIFPAVLILLLALVVGFIIAAALLPIVNMSLSAGAMR